MGDVIAVLSGNAVLTKAVKKRFERIKLIQKGKKKDEIRSSTIRDSGREGATSEPEKHGSVTVSRNDGDGEVGIHASGDFTRRKEVHRDSQLSA
jgi:hypothetical protein